MSNKQRHLPRGLSAIRQGVNDKGATRGAVPRRGAADGGGGTETSETGEISSIVLTARVLGTPRAEFTGSELKVIQSWAQSGGDLGEFNDLVSGNGKMLALLNTPKVRKAIEHMAGLGECVGLVADADEVAMRLTSLLRNRNVGSQMQMESAGNLARLKGMYPDKGTGGVNIQINFTGGLGD